MRYFIGHLIRGEAAEYYKATCADLATRFGVEDVSAIVPPHITVKSPFDRPNIDEVDNTLSLMTDTPAVPFELSNWGNFGTRTIFLDVKEPAKVKELVKHVLGKIREIGINLNQQEIDPHVHMSIARFLKPTQFEVVQKYLSTTPAPKFDLMFDNLTVFVKENRDDKAWKVLKTYPLIGIRN